MNARNANILTTGQSLAFKFIIVALMVMQGACAIKRDPLAETANEEQEAVVEEAVVEEAVVEEAVVEENVIEDLPVTSEEIVLDAGVAATQPTVRLSMQKIMRELSQNAQSFSFSYSGWIDSANNTVSGSGVMEYSEPQTSIYKGVTVSQQTTTTLGSLIVKGVPRTVKTVVTSFHDPITAASLADLSDKVYAVYSQYQYPISVGTGDKGVLTRALLYTDENQAKRIGYFEVRYNVEGNPEGPLIINIVTDRYSNDKTLMQSGSISYIASDDGRIVPIKGRSLGYPVLGQKAYEIFNSFTQ